MLGIVLSIPPPADERDNWQEWKQTADRTSWIGMGNTARFPHDDEGGNAGNEPKGGEGK